jgi:hypothetical protein
MLVLPIAVFLFVSARVNQFSWPKEISALTEEIEEHQIPYSKLPPHACERELENPNTGTTGALYIDLNGDGVKELIVDDGLGGSGGPDYRIYQRSHGTWKVIADFQGGLTLCQKANGYFQLEVASRGGGGATGKTLYRFFDGRYRAIHGSAYQDGSLTRELDAKDLTDLNNWIEQKN